MKNISKKLWLCFVALLLITCSFHVSVSAATNVYPQYQTISGVTMVRCTYYAWQQVYDRLGVAMPNFGDAKNWLDSAARNGYSTGSVATANSVAVYQGGSYGHVAFVTNVNGSKMTINEGGMFNASGTAALNGTGIRTGAIVNSTVGNRKDSYSSYILLGFIYFNSVPQVKVSYSPLSEKNTISSNNAEVWCKIDKTVGIGLEKIGIRIRKSSDSYSNGWSHFQEPSSKRVNDSWFYLSWNMNSELNLTLTHATQYNYQFYTKIGGSEYWSAEYSFTTTGSHSYGNWNTQKAATCTQSGTKTRKCSSCSKIETQTISALGHDFSSSFTVDKKATCTVEGSKSKHCSRCSAITSVTTIAKTDHSYSTWTIIMNSTCTTSGLSERKCSNCSVKDTKSISPLGHNYSTEWVVDKQATCTTAGSKSKHCTRCSSTNNNTTIPVKGHSWGSWITEKQATTKAEGLSARKCNDCNLRETQIIAKLATDGHTHKFSEWHVIKDATCKEKGYATRACSICKEQEQKELLATGHQYSEWVEVSATCTNDGANERTCTICNETERIKIEALGHDFANPIVIKEPTNNENGIKKGKCKRCGEETTEEIPTILSDNVSNTYSNKNTNNNLVIGIIIGVLVIGTGFGAYLILKKTCLSHHK